MAKTRKCVACGKRLPIEEFDIISGESSKKPKRNIYCRQCQKFIDMLDRQRQEHEKDANVTEASTINIDGFSQCIMSPNLSIYTDRELLDELKARGFEGKLSKTETIKTELEL